MLGIREEVNTCTGDQAEVRVREVAWVDENSDEVREFALPESTRIVTRSGKLRCLAWVDENSDKDISAVCNRGGQGISVTTAQPRN